LFDNQWLKIGVISPNSNARYVSHHYNPNSARSTLTMALLTDNSLPGRWKFDSNNPGR